MRSTKLLILLSIIGSACSCGVSRPDADLCVVNAPNKNRKCYNLKNDYNDDGSLKAGAKPVYRPNLTVEDLNKALVLDSPYDDQNPNPGHFEDGISRMKAWVRKLRDAATCQGGSAQ